MYNRLFSARELRRAHSCYRMRRKTKREGRGREEKDPNKTTAKNSAPLPIEAV
jgi:hypothetical protein